MKRSIVAGQAYTSLAALPLVMGLAPLACDHALVKTDCIEARALSVAKSQGGYVASGLEVVRGRLDANGEPCPALSVASVVFYREANDLPGYQGPEEAAQHDPPVEPDGYVSSKLGQSSQPTGMISIGAFSTSSPLQGAADSWHLQVVDVSGAPSSFSGSF